MKRWLLAISSVLPLLPALATAGLWVCSYPPLSIASCAAAVSFSA